MITIGLDLGTTHIKAAAIHADGRVEYQAGRRNHPVSAPDGKSEQDPREILRNTEAALTEVLQHLEKSGLLPQLNAIGLSAAMHGLMALDPHDAPLTHLWLWSDLRASVQARALRAQGGLDIYGYTGVPVHPMSPLCKLCWMREEMPRVFSNAKMFLGVKEFVWFHLTGQFMSDISCASATGLLDIRRNQWHPPALEWAGIRAEQLPMPVLTTTRAIYAGNNQELRRLLGKTPLVIGASDGALANIGSGATNPGQLAVTIGTSAAIRSVSSEPVFDEQMRTFCYRVDESRFIVGGASNNGANALEWLRRDVFESPLKPDAFARLAEEAPPGADGLLFIPYLQGERAPVWNPEVRGAFHGITSRHRQPHFVRAVMEGVLFNLKLIADAMNTPIESLHASGGFANSRAWVQMLADIFQKPVYVQQGGVDASVLGAVEVAGGETPENNQNETVLPDSTQKSTYEALFQEFKRTLVK